MLLCDETQSDMSLYVFFFNSHVTHKLNHHALAEKLINSPNQCIDNLLNSNLCSTASVFGSNGAAFVLIQ